MTRIKTSAIAWLIIWQAGCPAFAAGPANEAAIRSAWTLYTQQKYAPSADAFEALIKTSTQSARLYYYSAAANKAANRAARARQLCQYITANFSTSPEAGYAAKLFPDVAPQTASSEPAGLPEHLKGKSVDELMQTEEGRRALTEAMNKPSPAASASPSGSATRSSRSSSAARAIERPKDAAFTAEIIAAEGADGITQFVRHPDAGFECSLAAMAMLQRGREILATMIRCPGSQDIYRVRFPNGSTDYEITPAKMEKYRMKDSALWATLIHGAARESPLHSWEDGLTLLTGNRAEKILAGSTTQQALASFIGDAVRQQNPIVCLSTDDDVEPTLVAEYTGYTITNFDPASGMITLRNPKGSNSARFRLEDDPQHKKFEQLNGGVMKMHISIFSRYFKEVARATI